jgi:sugar phosphate isomerase/epimerase
VDSPWVRCDYDSANWITLDTIYDTTGALNHHFDVLGHHICSAHAKDIWVENRLAIHLQDGCPGKGLMDFGTLFQRLEALDPDYPIIAEGNSSEELPEVGALFHKTAKAAGIRVLDTGEKA